MAFVSNDPMNPDRTNADVVHSSGGGAGARAWPQPAIRRPAWAGAVPPAVRGARGPV
jgi:hypothetical protein